MLVESTGLAPKDSIDFRFMPETKEAPLPDTVTDATDIETTSVTSKSDTVRLPEVTSAEFVSTNGAKSEFPALTVIVGLLALIAILFKSAKL